LLGSIWVAQWRKRQVVNFSKMCCPNATRCLAGYSEGTEPIAQIKAPVATATHTVHGSPRRSAATAIADRLLPANWPRNWNTVQFSTHCDQI
jgi:hypothetical protein